MHENRSPFSIISVHFSAWLYHQRLVDGQRPITSKMLVLGLHFDISLPINESLAAKPDTEIEFQEFTKKQNIKDDATTYTVCFEWVIQYWMLSGSISTTKSKETSIYKQL